MLCRFEHLLSLRRLRLGLILPLQVVYLDIILLITNGEASCSVSFETLQNPEKKETVLAIP